MENKHKPMGTGLGYRGGVFVDQSRCTGCKKCYQICPADVFGFDGASQTITAEYPEECWFCGACIFECPEPDALQMELPLACL